VRVARRRIGAWYRLVIIICLPLLRILTRRDWQGAGYLPRTGGYLVCANHISHIDAFTLGHFLYDNGALPRYLAKSSLLKVPVVRQIVLGAKQIPVYRESRDALDAYRAAVEAVREGECVTIYPEATLTRDPGLWPMVGKTGAARIALATGCPVIPVVQWGPQDILAPYAKVPRLLPRRTVHVWAGPPVDLSGFAGRPLDAQVLREATAQITATHTDMLARIRQERPPTDVWDPREHDLPRTGNPRRKRSA
jgi:1-acyl-sn-glycerol-3-phosphate acyltransferase